MELSKDYIEEELLRLTNKELKYYTIKEIYNHNGNFILLLSNSKNNLELEVTKQDIFDFIDDDFKSVISYGLVDKTALVEDNKIKSIF